MFPAGNTLVVLAGTVTLAPVAVALPVVGPSASAPAKRCGTGRSVSVAAGEDSDSPADRPSHDGG